MLSVKYILKYSLTFVTPHWFIILLLRFKKPFTLCGSTAHLTPDAMFEINQKFRAQTYIDIVVWLACDCSGGE